MTGDSIKIAAEGRRRLQSTPPVPAVIECPEVSPPPASDSIQPAFQKRLKRHVIGRLRNYFAVTAPGLEKGCLRELLSLPLSVHNARTVSGGVEFKGRFADCCLANLHLRTAGRILMRLDSFKATGFGPLGQKLSAIPWELFLPPGPPPVVRVTTRHCRLYHSGAIETKVLDSVSERMMASRLPPAPDMRAAAPQQIFVRGADGRFVVSLDSSGENLYKRGIKQQGGAAPLRETLAAAILKTAGYSPGELLVDPMCGTGTFSLEAVMLNLNMPAGWFRDYAFTAWPSFRPQRWHHIRKECEGQFVTIDKPLVFASDTSSHDCDELLKIIESRGFSQAVAVSKRDFFDFSPEALTQQRGLVVINPPYGRRLGSQTESRELLDRIGRHLQSAYCGWKFALVVPNKRSLKTIPRPYRTTSLNHGGLRLTLITGKID